MLLKIAVALINLYQKYIRVFLPVCCRFTPSCSEYTKQAIVKFGFFIGIMKGAKRLLSCHPFSGRSGYDPIV